MRVLVIGGTGFISSAVVRQLYQQGHTLIIVHRGQTQAELPTGIQQVLAKRVQIPDFLQEFKHFAPEVVLDMIPNGEQDAQTVMQTFEGIAQRVVAISSGDVYRAYGRVLGTEPGPVDPVPLTEQAPLREKLYPYRDRGPAGQEHEWMQTYDKILVERAVMNHARLPGTILRLPMVYGPRDNQHRLFPYLKRMDDQRPHIIVEEGSAHWRWSRGYVEHVAAAVVLAVTDPRATGRIYNVSDEPTLTIAQWIRAIGDVAGWHGTILSLPQAQLPEALRSKINASQDLVYNTTRIRQELGYRELVSLAEALNQTIAWQRANPPNAIDTSQFDYALEDAVLAEVSGNRDATSDEQQS